VAPRHSIKNNVYNDTQHDGLYYDTQYTLSIALLSCSLAWDKFSNYYFLSPSSIGTRTLDLRIMSREFFRCATRTQPLRSKLACIYLSLLTKLTIFQFFSDLFPFSTNKKWQQKLLLSAFCHNWNSAITKKKISWSHIFLRLNNEISWRTIIAKPTQRRRQKDDATGRFKSSFLSSIEQCLLDANAEKQ